MADNKLIKTNVGDQVLTRIDELCSVGFTMPKDYSYVNAIKMSMLKLQDVKDKFGKPALEVCTPTSIQTALFKMATKGLNAALNQCYFIVRGNTLCCDESYFGKMLMVRRLYPNYIPTPVVIREGDVFEFGITPSNGMRYIIKHEQSFENIDKGFIGAYMYLPNGNLFIMTKKQIMTAWSKSSSKEQSVHKQFEEKMISKTIINSGLNSIINSTPEYNIADAESENEDEPTNQTKQEFSDFEDMSADVTNEQTNEEPAKIEQHTQVKEVENFAGDAPQDAEPKTKGKGKAKVVEEKMEEPQPPIDNKIIDDMDF